MLDVGAERQTLLRVPMSRLETPALFLCGSNRETLIDKPERLGVRSAASEPWV